MKRQKDMLLRQRGGIPAESAGTHLSNQVLLMERTESDGGLGRVRCCATSAEMRIVAAGSTRGGFCWWSASVSTAAVVMVHMEPNIRQSSSHAPVQTGANAEIANGSASGIALLVEAGIESVTSMWT
jgi:hypothetical protein